MFIYYIKGHMVSRYHEYTIETKSSNYPFYGKLWLANLKFENY